MRFPNYVVCLILLTSLNSSSAVTEFEYPYNFDLNVITNIMGPLNGIMGEYIRNSLLPLGIHFNIIPYHMDTIFASFFHDYPYAQYPLLDPPSWDIFGGGIYFIPSPFNKPEYGWKYQSSNNAWPWACWLFAPICEDSWEQKTGINQSYVDDLLERYETEQNMTHAVELSDEFNEIYFDELLYELPLVLKTYNVYYWKGFDLSTLSDFRFTSSIQNTYEAILKGLKISENHPERALMRNSTTFKVLKDWEWKEEVIPNKLIIDLLQPKESDAFKNEAQLIHTLLTKGVERTGNSLERFPDMAISWIQEDWVDENNITYSNAKDTFILRDDVYWQKNSFSPNTYYSGNEKVTVKDFKFTLDMYNLHPEYIPDLVETRPGLLAYRLANQIKYSINETENSISLYGNEPGSISRSGNMWDLGPTPEFLLNKTLTYNETVSGTPQELSDLGLSSYDTLEWNMYEESPITTGAYEIVDFIPGEKLSLRLRDNYFYPNEWDSPDHHFYQNKPKKAPSYFIFNATQDEPFQKPTKLFFEVINIESSGEMSEETIVEEGLFDVMLIRSVYLSPLIRSLHNDPRYIDHKYIGVESHETLYFNLANPHLQKINVRKAIAKVINLDEISRFVDQSWVPQRSLAPIFYKYTDDVFYKEEHSNAIKPSYYEARDLMRKEGYDALDKSRISLPVLSIPPFTPPIDTPLQIIPIIITFIVYSMIKRKNRHIKDQ
ncbi:MAG: hypothetical protein GPJ54_02895 [Candidatus Heimdallarchaeota archaeon]|nr:hypothetical protein [Candidatus Heimdallarchaeota archaeon]